MAASQYLTTSLQRCTKLSNLGVSLEEFSSTCIMISAGLESWALQGQALTGTTKGLNLVCLVWANVFFTQPQFLNEHLCRSSCALRCSQSIVALQGSCQFSHQTLNVKECERFDDSYQLRGFCLACGRLASIHVACESSNSF